MIPSLRATARPRSGRPLDGCIIVNLRFRAAANKQEERSGTFAELRRQRNHDEDAQNVLAVTTMSSRRSRATLSQATTGPRDRFFAIEARESKHQNPIPRPERGRHRARSASSEVGLERGRPRARSALNRFGLESSVSVPSLALNGFGLERGRPQTGSASSEVGLERGRPRVRTSSEVDLERGRPRIGPASRKVILERGRGLERGRPGARSAWSKDGLE